MTVPTAGLSVTPSIVLVRELGRGGMGAVWIADHVVLKRRMAVKLLDPERRASDSAVRRFAREAASIASVRSVHVVSVHDAGVSAEVGPFIVMELLVGRDLGSVLHAEGPLEPERAAAIVEEVARGLAKVHEAGLVHRDVKAENVFLCEEPGEPELAKVLDFGIALGDDDRLTEVGLTIGSRLSMSPEQAAGKPVDARSDAYSLALLAFRMITGQTAFPRESLDALGHAAYRAERPRPSNLRPELPAAVDVWFSRATEPDPAARFPNVLAVASGFRAALAGTSPVADTRLGETREDTAPDGTAEAGSHGAAAPPPNREHVAEPANLPRLAAQAAAGHPLRRAAAVLALTTALVGGALVATRALSRDSAGEGIGGASDVLEGGKPADLHLSLVMDVSGTNRKRGLALERAAQLGAAMVTESGGVRGRPLVIDTVDDQGDTGDFLRGRANDAVAHSETRVLLGPLLTVQTPPVQELARARGMIEVSASATGTTLAAGAAFLALAPSDDQQAGALADLVRGQGPSATGKATSCKRVAIVATNDAHGLPFGTALEAALARGARVATSLTKLDPAPRRSYATEMQGALVGADCLVLLVSPKLGARVLLSIPAATRKALRVLAGDTLASNDFIELGRGDVDDSASATVAEGVEGVAVGTSPSASPEYRTFLRRHQERFHADADEPFAARQFDAIVVSALALERAGIDASGPRLHAEMIAVTRGKHGYGPAELGRLFSAAKRGEDVAYEGAAGDLTFGSDGRVAAAFDVWTVRDAKLVRAPR